MANQVLEGLGVHHIALRCSDLDRSLRFYCEALGCKPLYSWGEGDHRICMVDLGDGTIIELFAGGRKKEEGSEEEAGRFFHLALRTQDVQKAYDCALAAGAQTRNAPNVVDIDAKPEPIKLHVAFVYGLDGEVLEFFRML